jgi:hypothetical protein
MSPEKFYGLVSVASGGQLPHAQETERLLLRLLIRIEECCRHRFLTCNEKDSDGKGKDVASEIEHWLVNGSRVK